MDWSAARGHQDVIAFLLDHRKEGCTEKALDWSSHGGHRSINTSLADRATVRVRFALALARPLRYYCVTILIVCF